MRFAPPLSHPVLHTTQVVVTTEESVANQACAIFGQYALKVRVYLGRR